MKKYQFFGDIHGEPGWKDLVNPDCIQIFLGDYFSPYKLFTFEQCRDNFLEIMKFKEDFPDTILLLGNHDYDILFQEGYSRLDYEHIPELMKLILKYKNNFKIAHDIGDYLITHAGVSADWIAKYLPDVSVTPNSIASSINELWKSGKYSAFDFASNANEWDCYGTSSTHGPMWIRWESLIKSNVFKGTNYKQIVGHTLDNDFKYSPNKSKWNLVCIDCMAYKPQSLILEI